MRATNVTVEKHDVQIASIFKTYPCDSGDKSDKCDKRDKNDTSKKNKSVPELNNTCGICGKDLDSGQHEFIGKGLGNIHTKCKYESRRVRATRNTQYVNMNHTPAQMIAGEVYDIPAIQAMDFIRSGLVVVCDEVTA